MWRIPHAGADYVAAMEDVLEVYHRLYDEQRPVVCIDETNRQLYRRNPHPVPFVPDKKR